MVPNQEGVAAGVGDYPGSPVTHRLRVDTSQHDLSSALPGWALLEASMQCAEFVAEEGVDGKNCRWVDRAVVV